MLEILADLIGLSVIDLILLGLFLNEPGHFSAHFSHLAVGLGSVVEGIERLGALVHIIPALRRYQL